MENFVYPNAIHLRLLLSNCNVETPLTHPEIGVYQSYPGALWQIFLSNYFDETDLIRFFWESYGTRITNGETQVTFFDIFNNQILSISSGDFNLEDMYKEYSIRRYFTGDRAIGNQYFDEASLYCTSSTIEIPENNILLQSQLGGNYYIEVPNNNNNILIQLESESTVLVPALLIGIDNDDNIILTDLELLMGNNIINIDSQYNGEYILSITSGYSGEELNFENIIISMDVNTSIIEGDINQDLVINVQDIILLVNFIISDEYQINGDLNNDGLLNVIDIVQLVNIILG